MPDTTDNTRYSDRQDTRIALAAILELRWFEHARRHYRFYRREFYAHLQRLREQGIVKNLPAYEECLKQDFRVETIGTTPQLLTYAYTDLSWKKASTMTDDECREAARKWLEREGELKAHCSPIEIWD